MAKNRTGLPSHNGYQHGQKTSFRRMDCKKGALQIREREFIKKKTALKVRKLYEKFLLVDCLQKVLHKSANGSAKIKENYPKNLIIKDRTACRSKTGVKQPL